MAAGLALPRLSNNTCDYDSSEDYPHALGIATVAAWAFIAPFLPIIATAAAVVAAIALVSTFSFADTGAEQAIRNTPATTWILPAPPSVCAAM